MKCKNEQEFLSWNGQKLMILKDNDKFTIINYSKFGIKEFTYYNVIDDIKYITTKKEK